MNLNLELILVIGTLVTGVIVLMDKFILAENRRKRVLAESYEARFGDARNSGSAKEYKEPWYVDYSRSFFPVLLVVLILRSFIAEPFRIPSGSMMPTLLHGDFILVNKYSYGLRLPVLHEKVWANGLPERGDVIVFRYPNNPAQDYIKRVVGLPGDKITYQSKKLFVNGNVMEQTDQGAYMGFGRDAAMTGARKKLEQLFSVRHEMLVDDRMFPQNNEWVVPDGQYFVMGDNRDNSNDSRRWGTVPEENLVGKAFMVWMNWDVSEGQFDLSRIGRKIK